MTGRSLAIPFQRGAADFRVAEQAELERMQAEQALATECSPDATGGELPWRTSFGTPLHLLRHRAMTQVLVALARVWVRDALTRSAPTLKVSATDVSMDDSALRVAVRLASSAAPAAVSRPTGG